MTFEQLATRLAGGLAKPVDDDAMREATKTVLPETELGDLDKIKTLPGMVGAAADTLRKAWRAGIDLQARMGKHPRLDSVAILEAAVMQRLPPTMVRPSDLVGMGRNRLVHAKTLFGPIEIVGITELSPVWRPLLHAIAEHVTVRWVAGPRRVPDWLDKDLVEVVETERRSPEVAAVSAATPYHEAVEALRWARQLVATEKANPAEIAIACVSTTDYDDHFLGLRDETDLDLHFVHGVKVTASREGQEAAALADILLRGLSQTRVRRLNTLLRVYPGLFRDLPEGWTRILPAKSILSSREAWYSVCDNLTAEDWPDGVDHNPELRAIVELLDEGIEAAEGAGEKLLRGRALAIWRRALAGGAAASLDLTLETLRQDDGLEACASVCWMPASSLAASPRPFVRLVGLNSTRWPRNITEDRLLSDHIVSTSELDPLPLAAADRRDFETIMATTDSKVILSRARRDEDGRLLGRSQLLHQTQSMEIFLPGNAVPKHAFSETDRLMARPIDFRELPQARAASKCWNSWWSANLTPHDGLVRRNHPVIGQILDRIQSASSLRLLLRNPLGFVWRYGLRWSAPDIAEDPLTLDALAKGNLVHQTLDRALRLLEANGGVGNAGEETLAEAVETATQEVARLWEGSHAVPPQVVWNRTLNDLCAASSWALAFPDENRPNTRAYSEVPFGGAESKSDATLPWDATAPVEIPGTDFRIQGFIDRLDLSVDGRTALVRDYKTGRAPKKAVVINGGKELQRCIYACAVRSLLGDEFQITASLLYLRDERDLVLDHPDTELEALVGHLQSARTNLASGGAVIGDDAGDQYDDLAFALPANSRATYFERKNGAVIKRLGSAAQVWEAK